MQVSVAEAIEIFAKEQATLGLAPLTVRQQGNYLRLFGQACQKAATERGKRSPLQVREIDGPVIVSWFEKAAGLGQGARNNRLIALKKFLTWCELNRYLKPGDTARLLAGRKVRTPTRSPKCYVPAEQFPALIDSATRHPADRIVMSLAIFTLARQSEISGIRLKDVDLSGATIHVHRSKKKRWTDVAISHELMGELIDWLTFYASETGYGTPEKLMATQPEWRLVPRLVPIRNRGPHGFAPGATYEIDPLSGQRHLERVIKRGLDAIGAVTSDGKKVRHLGEGIHTIRRSGARAMLRHLSETLGNDRALLQVATMLDHQDTQVTLLYIGLDQEREQLNDWLRSNSMYGTATSTAVRRLRAVV